MTKYFAVDFEAANDHKLSACSIVTEEKNNVYDYVENLIGFVIITFSVLFILQTLT